MFARSHSQNREQFRGARETRPAMPAPRWQWRAVARRPFCKRMFGSASVTSAKPPVIIQVCAVLQAIDCLTAETLDRDGIGSRRRRCPRSDPNGHDHGWWHPSVEPKASPGNPETRRAAGRRLAPSSPAASAAPPTADVIMDQRISPVPACSRARNRAERTRVSSVAARKDFLSQFVAAQPMTDKPAGERKKQGRLCPSCGQEQRPGRAQRGNGGAGAGLSTTWARVRSGSAGDKNHCA